MGPSQKPTTPSRPQPVAANAQDDACVSSRAFDQLLARYKARIYEHYAVEISRSEQDTGRALPSHDDGKK